MEISLEIIKENNMTSVIEILGDSFHKPKLTQYPTSIKTIYSSRTIDID